MITLNIDDVLKIKKTAIVREYNSETPGFKGKSYNIYAFRDKAFAVHQDDQFQKDFEQGNIFSCELEDSDEGLSLLNHTTVQQAVGAAKAKALVGYYSSEKYTPSLNLNEIPA